MPQIEVVNGVTLVHDFKQRISDLTDASYSPDILFPHSIDIEDIGFTDRNPIQTFSSPAGAIVAIKVDGDKWGVYSGSFLDRADRNNNILDPEIRDENKTLEDFLDLWRDARPKAEVAFLFGIGFFSDCFNTLGCRRRIVEMVMEATGLPAEKVVERWNRDDITDTEVNLSIHPLISTIRLSDEGDPALAAVS